MSPHDLVLLIGLIVLGGVQLLLFFLDPRRERTSRKRRTHVRSGSRAPRVEEELPTR